MTAASTTPVGLTPAIGPPPPRSGQTPAERRVVESTDQARLHEQGSATTPRGGAGKLAELSHAARRFAEVLETTGSVALAASISGFSPGGLDTFA